MAAGCYRVTVEPVLFLYMLAMFMLLPALQDLIYTKVCLGEFSQEVCENLYSTGNSAALDAVQTNSSHWVLSSTFSLALSSIITAQFLGSWSDSFGRKIPMLLPPTGAVFASLLYIVMSVKLTQVPVGLVVLASLITGLCGGFTSCIMNCMSYVAQISSAEARTVHVGVMESMSYVGGTLGPLLGGWVQQAWGRSTTFIIIMACHAAIVVYIVIFVRNISPRHPPEKSWVQSGCSFHHFREAFATVSLERQEKRRTFLFWLLAAASVVMICIAGQLDILYLYVKDKPIEWPLAKYTWYFAFKYALGGVALLVVLPLCSRIPDMILAVMGLLSKILEMVLLGLAWNDAMVFSSAAVSMLGCWPVAIIRSAVSKLVEPNEQGKVFAFVALLENTCTLVATGVFNSVYPATRHLLRGFTFFMAAVALLVPLAIVSVLHRSLHQINSIEFRELNEETTNERNEEEGGGSDQGKGLPETSPAPAAEEETQAMQIEGPVEQPTSVVHEKVKE